MSKSTVDSHITAIDAQITAYRDSITRVENLRDELRGLNLGVFSHDQYQADTTQHQKHHISGALAHLEGWLVIQRFRLIDREEQARKMGVQTGVELGRKAALDAMRSPQAPYTHIGVDPGSEEGDYEGTHPLTEPSGE